MSYLIVYAHPYEKSFNHATLEVLTDSLKKQNIEYSVIDLHADNFNPAYDKEELQLFYSGKTHDPLVTKYQELVKKADHLVFIFPIWWGDLPAIVKGFFDKVMKKDFAYVPSKMGLTGTLTHIKKAYVFTSASSPKWFITLFGGNAIKATFIRASLKTIGIKKVKWYHISFMNAKTLELRQKYLAKIANILK